MKNNQPIRALMVKARKMEIEKVNEINTCIQVDLSQLNRINNSYFFNTDMV